MPSSSLGQAIPLLYGESRIASNLVFAVAFTSIPHSGGPSGGKSGGRSVFVQYTYAVSVILALCEGALEADGAIPCSNPQQAIEIGRATPGAQVLTISDKTGQKAKAQPEGGIAPGCWKTKRVRRIVDDQGDGLAEDGDDRDSLRGFRPIRFHDFGTDQFVTAPGDFLHGAFKNRHSLNPNGGIQHVFDNYIIDTNEQYPGIACMARQNMRLGSNASMPSLNFPVRGLQQYRDIYPDEPGGINGPVDEQLTGADPACILFDLLTNPKHGAGWDRAIYAAMLVGHPNPWGAGLTGGSLPADSWSAYCRAQHMLLSPFWDSQRAAADIVSDLAEATNSAVVWSEGRLKMVPYGTIEVSSAQTGVTFTPTNDPDATTDGANIAVRYVLSLDDIVPGKHGDPVTWERRSMIPDARGDYKSDGYFNHIRTEFLNAANGYAVEVAEAKDEPSIGALGVVSREPDRMHEVTNGTLAQEVAERRLARFLVVRNVCKLTLTWRHLLLEPMDVIELPPEEGSLRVRVTMVEEDRDGTLSIEGEEYPGDRAASAIPDPPTDTAVFDDLGGLILGHKGTVDQANSINPQYIDVTGSLMLFAAEPAGEWFGEVQGWYIRSLAVLFHSEGAAGPTAKAVRSRVRFNIDGVSRTEFELVFYPGEEPITKVATGALFVRRGARLCIEIAYFDGVVFYDPSTVGESYREHGLNWSIGWEPADA